MGNQSHQVSKQGLFQRPAHYVPEATLMQHVRERFFSVQRLNGFRQVVTHIQSRQTVEL